MDAFKMFLFPYLMVLIILVCNIGLHSSGNKNMVLHDQVNGDYNQYSIKTSSPALDHQSELLAEHSWNRKLLATDECTNKDISISQSKDSSSSGIPQYIVQIVNTCVSGCAPSHIHVHCGWFASARIVNPKIFKRLSHDDCLVNDGRPLENSQIIRFTYSNSFMYSLSFRTATFC